MPIQVTSLLPCLHMHDYCGSEREREREGGGWPPLPFFLSPPRFSLSSVIFFCTIYMSPAALLGHSLLQTQKIHSSVFLLFTANSRRNTLLVREHLCFFQKVILLETREAHLSLSLSLSVLSLSFLYSFTKEVRQMPCTWLCGFLVNLGDNFWFVISCFLPTNQNLYNSRTYMERNASFLPVLSLSLSLIHFFYFN